MRGTSLSLRFRNMWLREGRERLIDMHVQRNYHKMVTVVEPRRERWSFYYSLQFVYV